MNPLVEFTRESYRRLLEAAATSGYRFSRYDDNDDASSPVCFLRHDVDVDLGAAVRMAEIEQAQGVRATYFLMLRSPIYNLLSRENQRLAERLLELGHDLGLHYDGGFIPSDRRTLEGWISAEREILESLFHVNITAASFHQPSVDFLQGPSSLGGMTNVYRIPDCFYLSDSNMVFRSGSPFDVFAQRTHDRIQLLIHPIWWDSDLPGRTTDEMFDQALSEACERSQRQLLATEAAYGPRRHFSLGRQGQ